MKQWPEGIKSSARLERFQEKLQTFPVRKRDEIKNLERFFEML